MNNQVKTNSHETQMSVAESGVRSVPGESRTCHNYWCNYTTDESLTRCPKCGRSLITAQTFRLLGLVLVFLGGLLAIGGALLLIFAAPKVSGGIEVKLLIWSVFGFLLAVGLTFVTAGFWQVLFGKRNQGLMTFVIGLLIALALIVVIGRAVL